MEQVAESTLQRRAGSDGLAPAIAGHVRAQADVAESALGSDAARHVESLRTFAQYVEARPVEDLRIVTLYALGGPLGWSGVEYTPGEKQATLFGQLGSSRPAPSPSATLDELVSVAAEDALAAAGLSAEQTSRARDAALAEAQTAREAAEAAKQAIAERDTLTVEVAELQAEIASKDAMVAHLQSMIAPAPEPSEPRRRKAVDGTPGVYISQRASGTAYEISWTENGRRRWRTIGDDLDEAIAARAEITEQTERAAA